MPMNIPRRKARWIGVAAIGAVVLLQAFNSFACYHHGLNGFLSSTAFFVGIPLLPSFVSLALPNPLRAVVACAFFAPWLVLAYYADCVAPYEGGGASMIYVAVLMWGSVTSLIGALVAGALLKGLGIEVTDR